jgi:hypothetical protein
LLTRQNASKVNEVPPGMDARIEEENARLALAGSDARNSGQIAPWPVN